MEKKFLRKLIMVTLIAILAVLNVFMLTIQIVNAEEETPVSVDPILEGTLEKYINYDISNEDKGTLVQYHLRTGINYKEESEVFPVKENETTIYVGQIDGKYPYDVKVIINSTETTNGNIDKYTNTNTEYNPDTGVLTIKMHNQDENGNMISDKIPSSDSRDDYIVVCYYDTYIDNPVEREVSLNISSKMTLFTNENKEVYAEGELKNVVSENTGDLTSIKHNTDDIYNGYIKSNIINATEYNTQYTETAEINVSKKEAHQKMQITEENTFVRTNGEEIVEDLGNNYQLVYRSTKLEKQNIVELLGENGSIEISDENGNVLATIDNNTQFAEDGTITITYENDVESLNIKTSNIINEGILYIENTKEIKNTMRDIGNVQVKTTTNIIGINEEEITTQTEENTEETQIVETESYRKTDENLVEMKDAKSNVSMVVSSTEWTNKQQNDITFDISLDSDSIRNNLFKDTTLKIQLPSQVEKVILGNSSIVYGNGLTLQEPYTETDENGNISIIANLSGAQTQYDQSDLGLITDVKISATIILKKDIENVTDKLNLVYTNNYTLDGNAEEGNIETSLNIRSYTAEENPIEEMMQNVNLSAQETPQDVIDSLRMEVTPVKGDVTLNDGDTVYEGEYIKYNIRITNISDTAIEGVKVIGNIPDGTTYGELYAEHDRYRGEYYYNLDSSVKEKQIDVGTINPGETYETFYEVQVNDLNNGEEQKQIISNIATYVNDTQANTYEITNTIENAEVKVFLKSMIDNSEDRWTYQLNVESSRDDDIALEIKLPEEFEIDSVWRPEGKFDYEYDETQHMVTIVVKPGNYYVGGFIYNSSIDKTNGENSVELVATAKAIYNNKEYRSNENRIEFQYYNTNVQLTSSNEGKEVTYGEEIEYEVEVSVEGQKNIGEYGMPLVNVNLLDYLPSDVEPVSVTYDNWEEVLNEEDTVLDEEGNIEEYKPTGEYTKTQVTENISSDTTNDDGNRVANVDLLLNIPYGETAHITIKTTAGLVYERTTVENSVTISNEQTGSKTSNKVTHIILPLDYEEPTDPDNPGTEDPDNPGTEDPDNPNPDNPNNPEDNKYDIQGVAWLDENEDGARQSSEQLLNGITVLLVDMQNSGVVKEKTQTNNNGAYGFYDLDESQYVIIFQYDTDTYYVTEYQNSGVSETLNSDAMAQTITLNGEQIEAGVTDILTIDNSVSNIDIGLVENKTFDLKLDKYISRVTVQTNKKTVTYSYDDQELVKVDIHSKELNGARVNVEYKIVVTNEGELSAKVGSVKDYLPDGFVLDDNMKQTWIQENDGTVINNSMANDNLNRGESVTLTLTATKTMTEDSTGVYINKAEIAEASNAKQVADMDSTPGNNIETEDDFSKAEIIISVETGRVILYISIFFGVAAIIGVGIFLIKKYGISKKVKTTFMVLFALGITLFVNVGQVSAAAPQNVNFTWCFTYRGDEGNYWCGHGYNDSHGSTHFTGGINGAGGICVNADLNPAGFNVGDTTPSSATYTFIKYTNTTSHKSTSYYVWNGSSWQSVNSLPSKILSIANGYSTVGVKVIDNNYILGPLKINTNIYNGGYTFEVKGTEGNTISASTCNASGEAMTVRGSTEFYLKVSASDVSKGISSIKATASGENNSGNVTKTTTKTYKTSNVEYDPGNGKQSVETLNKVIHDEHSSNSYGKASVTWTQINGVLEIIKQDADDSSIVLSGVRVRVQNEATGYDQTFTTDSNGRIRVENLVAGTYKITELSNNNYGYSQVESGQTTMYSGIVKEYVLKNTKQTGNIKIVKKDANNNSIVLPGISFKIRNASGQYIIAVDSNGKVQKEVTGTIHLGNVQTTTNINDATAFITDNNGMISIYNLLVGEYQVIETSIGDNFGYEVGDGYITWESNMGTGSGNNSSVEVTRKTSANTGTTAGTGDNLFDILTIKNKRAYIKIRGYAWEEKTDGKNSVKDGTWNDGTEDKRLANVTVRLKNANGQTLGTAITNTNGEYVFGNYDEDEKAIKLKIDDLVGAYIEFEYNGMSYQSIDVEPEFIYQSETRTYYGNKNTATDSALREQFNNNYATISKGISSNTNGNKTYDIRYNYDSTNHKSTVIYGDNVKYGYEGQTYPISGTYDQYTIQAVTAQSSTNALCTQLTPQKLREQAIVEIGGLNLGVEERAMPDLAVVEDMQNVQITFNDYTHTYEYGRRFDDPSEYAGGDPFDTIVKFANKYLTNSYSREVYSSDVVYNKQNEGSLQVFITYKVQLRNESSDVYSNLKTLANYYDERYENVVVRDENENIIESQVDNSYNQNGMKKVNIQTNYLIAHGETRELTITYQLSNEAINALLNQDITLDSITEVTSYSTYSDSDYSVPYAGIDIDSAPDTVDPSNVQGTIEDDTDRAPSLIIILKEGRMIEGTVWEDSAIEGLLQQSGYDKERKGNGTYDTDENVVNNVTVELMTVTESGDYELAKLYKRDETVVDATTTTTGLGEYSFSGVIPSNYVLRFTYGNNSVIVDASGNTVGNVNANNYKSTIYRGGNKEAVDAMTNYWYRGETSNIEGVQRLSDARDIFGIMENGTRIDNIVQYRTTEDDDVNYQTTQDRQLAEVSADTRQFEIKLDYDINLDNISKYEDRIVSVFDNIDFGIIERPRQDLELDKQVANIQITLANGTTLINGDPRSQNLSGVRVLDNHDVYIEMDNELIQGATLTVTYEISVDNTNCEIDYNDEDYYIYGIVPEENANWKIATVIDMYDYLPDELLLQANNSSNWEKITVNDTDKGTILTDEVYEVVKGLQNIVHLKTPIFEDMQPGTRRSDTTLVVSRQLSTSSDDLTYENDVEIIKLKGRPPYNSTPGNYDPTTNTPDERDDGHVPVTITAPTGENRQYVLYGILGISTLIIVGVGIIFIKRKVLKN